MNFTSKQKSQINKATLASIIPGGGQFLNKQVLKGVIFLVIFALYILHLFSFGFDAFNGLVTLGVTPREDHSLFLLIEGVLELLITVIFIIFYAVQMWDARNVAKLNAINPDKVNRSAKDILNNLYESGFPYLLTIPAYILMLFAIVFPVVVTILIVFTNYDFQHIPPAKLIEWTGLETFNSIFTLATYRETFGAVFSWTVIWTLFATTLQVGLGIFLAILMNQPFIKFRRFFGVILLLPWAVPAFISILTFSNMFNPSAGAINSQVIPFINNLIPFLEIPALAWKTDPFWTKVALISIQGWLGFPYIYVLTTSILQSIPGEWYEAASIDGASPIQKFRFITFPHILSVAAPVLITQYTGNFNNFSMIYLFNEGGPGSVGNNAGTTDILISWVYKLTTGQSPQYNVSSAITIIISTIVIVISLIIFKYTNAFEMED
ncbi:carbohydrate ABC transporter permease [Aerococcus urinaeequi]|uniref:Maltose/maltodextrin transport system permease protein n=1 Tax=Aerococcus viridans TaxID=1377 RepID=A0A2N6UCI0_9LACT|nr:sugar ABC transporter permease [Aerococcus viridans]